MTSNSGIADDAVVVKRLDGDGDDIEVMDHASEGLDPDESEFDLAGVERAACREISPQRVASAPFTMECRLRETLVVAGRVQLVGDVVYGHVDEAVTTDAEVDSRKLDTVGRLGGRTTRSLVRSSSSGSYDGTVLCGAFGGSEPTGLQGHQTSTADDER